MTEKELCWHGTAGKEYNYGYEKDNLRDAHPSL